MLGEEISLYIFEEMVFFFPRVLEEILGEDFAEEEIEIGSGGHDCVGCFTRGTLTDCLGYRYVTCRIENNTVDL